MIFLRKKAEKLFLRRTIGLKRLKNEIYFVTECRKKRRKGESELRKALILLTLWRKGLREKYVRRRVQMYAKFHKIK